MHNIQYLLMFCSSFFTVFLLGIQSKNIINSRYLAAVVTSFGISVAQFAFIKFVASGSYTAFFICAFGACAGVSASIWFYDHVLKRKDAIKIKVKVKTTLGKKLDSADPAMAMYELAKK